MDLSLNTHPHQYTFDWPEKFHFTWTLPYAERHRDLSTGVTGFHYFLHRSIACLESIPILGVLIGTIEKIIVKALNFFLNISSPKSEAGISSPICPNTPKPPSTPLNEPSKPINQAVRKETENLQNGFEDLQWDYSEEERFIKALEADVTKEKEEALNSELLLKKNINLNTQIETLKTQIQDFQESHRNICAEHQTETASLREELATKDLALTLKKRTSDGNEKAVHEKQKKDLENYIAEQGEELKKLITVENEKNRALDEIKELKTQLALLENRVNRGMPEKDIKKINEDLKFLEDLLSPT